MSDVELLFIYYNNLISLLEHVYCDSNTENKCIFIVKLLIIL